MFRGLGEKEKERADEEEEGGMGEVVWRKKHPINVGDMSLY